MGPLRAREAPEVGHTHMVQKLAAAVVVEDRWEVLHTGGRSQTVVQGQ